MSRFRFSLQRLLDLRRAAERAQAAATGRATQETERCREVSTERASELDQLEQQASAAEVTPAGLRHAWGMTTDAARNRLELAGDELRLAEAAQQHELDRLTDAHIARRSLERLREKRQTDWSTETGRKEQAESDEIGRRHHGKEEGQ